MSMFSLLLFLLLSLQETDSIAVMSVDIGSEWLKIAIVKPGVPMEIALNKESRRKTPLVLSMKEKERNFGDPALGIAIKHPKNAYIYLTHILGKKYDSEAVQLYKKRFPFYNLVKDKERGTVLFEAENNHKYSVEELLAMVLNNTRHIAENFADHPMKDAVLTVPVYFNQAERKAVLDAANMTGLNILQLINDNTAVALNYGIFRASSFNSTMKHIMFFDMGSSHTTVTIVGYSTTKVKDRGYVETVPQLVVKGVGFDPALGGLEMDMRLRDHLVKAFKAKHKCKNDITKNPRAMAKLLKEARRVRQVLSANTDHRAQVENLFEEHDFAVHVTRAELEEMCKDLFEHVDKPIKMALNAAAMTMNDIESVILMGGATRIPKVQDILIKTTGKKELGKNINTDEAASLGAVYKAADLTAGFKVKRFIVKDLNMYPIDVEFDRTGNDESVRRITRNLYHRLNPLPQKKIMTFNKKPKDFDFHVKYGDLTFLSNELVSHLMLGGLCNVKLSGVEAAHEKNVKATPKGIKAFFNLDESGILRLEKVEAHFEKSPELVEEESQSTFSKLGSKLSSFFGSSKSEDETVETAKETSSDEKAEKKDMKKEESKKTEEKPTEKPKESKKSDNVTKVGANETASNKTEEMKPTKPVVAKEELAFAHVSVDLPRLEKESFDASVKRLNELEARDQAKFATEKARNSLESYIFEFKNMLDEESFQKISTKEERTKLQETFSAASDWLDEEGFDADETVLVQKLKTLKEAARDIQFRKDESVERPKAIASLLQSLNLTSVFFDSIKSIPDSKEIYSEKDIKDMKKITSEAREWLMTTWKKQNETSLAVKPVFLSKDILYQQGKVDREMMYLINKAKYYVPKPKPKANTTTSNATQTNGTKSETNKTETAEPVKDGNATKDKKATKEGPKEKPAGGSGEEKLEIREGSGERQRDEKEQLKTDKKPTGEDHHEPDDEL